MKKLGILVAWGAGIVLAQNTAEGELRSLRSLIAAQQQQLRRQQQELAELQREHEETERRILAWIGTSGIKEARAGGIEPIPAVNQAPAPQPTSGSRPAPPKPATQASGIHIPIFSGQEIGTPEDAASPSLRLGPADVRILGYVGLSGLWRNAAMGSGAGTSFLSVPYSTTAAGNITEFRVTTQTSRLALRLDVPFQRDRLAAYIEADFGGAVPGNALVSSSSYGFRVRHAWVDYRLGKFEVAGGQMFSLLTPSKADIQTWPGDVLTTQAVDTNYVAGLVWDRSPALRFVYRPNSTWALAASLENPEQQVGGSVRFPKALATVLSQQYNTGRGDLRTPNLAGDMIFKAAFNRKLGGRSLHIDAATVLRVFRSYNPLDVEKHKSARGYGGNLNFAVDLTSQLRLVGQGFVSSGGGRYIGGLLPDVIVRPDGEISPVKAHSWVSGLEWAPSRRLSTFLYYSGLYGSRNTALDSDGSEIGFGYAGSNGPRRSAREWTMGWAHTVWSGEDRGSVQYATQYSYLTNLPWWHDAGPAQSNVHLMYFQIRYNLP